MHSQELWRGRGAALQAVSGEEAKQFKSWELLGGSVEHDWTGLAVAESKKVLVHEKTIY